MSDKELQAKQVMRHRGVTIAAGVTLPLSVVTSRLGVFGVSGSGKTYTASVIAEGILAAHAHLVVIDPLGVWWGLRAGDTEGGTNPHYPIYIFGGEHGDLPIYPSIESAEAVADIVAQERVSAILDLGDLEPEEQATFAGRFARRLYRAQAAIRRPLHCIVDEADVFAPETPGSSAEWECRRAFDTMVRRGRVRGLGVSLISQRPAVVAKNLLTQVGTLIVHRITAAQDRQSVDGWFRSQGSENERKTVLASLASLPVGEAWIWSPSDFGLFERVAVRRRKTFDSSATPQVGEEATPPRPTAPLDIAALRARLDHAMTAETSVLVRQKSGMVRTSESKEPVIVERIVTVERPVPVLSPDATEQLRTALAKITALQSELAQLTAAITPLMSLLPLAAAEQMAEPFAQPVPTGSKAIAPMAVTVKPAETPTERKSLVQMVKEAPPAPSDEAIPLQRGAKRILQVLARYPKQRLSHAQLGTLTRLTPSGGTYQKYMTHLRQNGFVTTVENGLLQITAAGMATLGKPMPPEPHTVEEVLALWQPALRRREFEILQHLVAIRPRSLPVEELATQFRLSQAGGAFGGYLGTLRRNGLVAVRHGAATATLTIISS